MIKNTKLRTLFVFAIMIVIFYFIIRDDYENIINNLLIANKWFILLGLAFIFVYYLLKAYCMYLIVKEHDKKMKFRTMFNQIIITQFFNGITPFSTGGQPMQVYMLKRSGIKIGTATNIIIQDFLMFQLALITIGVFAIASNAIFDFFEISPALYTFILLGFIINIAVGLCLVFISFSKRFNNFVGKLIIKIGAKTRIIKNKEQTIELWENKLEEFHESSKIFKNKRALFIRCYVFNVLALLSYYIIPFFIFISFDSKLPISVVAVIVSSAFVLLVGNFVPIPGGSGGIEYSFIKIFGSFLNDSLISSALIIWRFITYYLGVLLGGIALGFLKGSEKK